MGSGAGGIYDDTYGYWQDSPSEYSDHAIRARGLGPQRSARTPKHGANREPTLLERNAEALREKFHLGEDGYFAEKGSKPYNRVHRTDEVLADAKEFFEKISKGANQSDKENLTGYASFSGGARVAYRQTTKTPDSPAVEIWITESSWIKSQKIHFVRRSEP